MSWFMYCVKSKRIVMFVLFYIPLLLHLSNKDRII